jgi:hypothetical protein
MLRPVRFFFLVGFLLLGTLARATETENFGLAVLPAPGKVVVDGKYDDWDLSGSIFACGDAEHYRDKFGVWFAAMYDPENLYLLARWNDDTPLNNPGSTAGDFGWNGDCLQVRIITHYQAAAEQVTVLSCWKGADGRDVVDRDTRGKTKNTPKGDDIKPLGAQQAFQVHADNKGYVQEIAVPWKLLTADGAALQAGDKFILTIEPNFTAGPGNGRISIKDIFRPGVNLDRVFTFQNKRIWGEATLESHGLVEPRSVRLSDGREFKTHLDHGVPVADWIGLIKVTERAGFKEIPFDMPEEGYVSVQILGPDGRVVRQLLTAELCGKGKHSVKWDGLTTASFRRPGTVVPEGEYTWRAIYHRGIGMRLRGWACNAGGAPWDGPQGNENWGGDMGTPCAVACDGQQVYLGWAASEAGKALVTTDFDSHVQWRHKRGGFGGAQHVAVDQGVVFVVDGKVIFCLDAKRGTYLPWAGTTAAEMPINELWPVEEGVDRKAMPDGVTGMDAHAGKLYLAAGKDGREFVASVDIRSGKVLRISPVPAPGRLKAVSDALLYVVSGGDTVLALNPLTGQSKPILSRLTGVASVTTDAAGDIYVGVNGTDVQVQVFDKAGKFLRAIGRKGGRPALGPWQAQGLLAIAGIAVDRQGQLWVAEGTAFPRRFSVWNAQNGRLIKELFGPTHYGASGGAIHPRDPNVMVGEGCEWRLDPATGQASCTGVFDVQGGNFLGGNSFALFCHAPNGRDYLATIDPGRVTIRERLAPGNYVVRSTVLSEHAKKITTFWADENGDGQVQPNEQSTLPRELVLGGYYHWSAHMNTDMTLYGGGVLPISGFTPCGAPKYDPAAFRDNALPPGVPSLDNKFLLACGVERFPTYRCYDVATAGLLWEYPNDFAGVHGSHEAPPPAQGMIRGSFGPVGAAQLPTIGQMWAVNTNVGEWHILTQDGYYLTHLFQSDPLKFEFPAKVIPGAVIDNIPSGMGGEDFGGSLVQATDGKIYLEAGKCALWNCQVVGFETIKRLAGGRFSMGAEDLRQAEHFREVALQEVSRGKAAQVKNATIRYTGNLAKDFAGVEVLAYQKQDDAAVRSALAWDAQYLYVAWDVTDKTPWTNGASDPAQLYLSGDTVDLQMGTDTYAAKDRGAPVAGDLRVSIGNLQGTATAVVYRKVATVKKPKHFSSGVVRDYVMDFVDVLPTAKINVCVRPQAGYLVEAAIAWADLGVTPHAGLTVRGDLGVTHGDLAGQRTRLRTYWSNQHTGIVDDAVYELMMEPKNWGEFRFTGK